MFCSFAYGTLQSIPKSGIITVKSKKLKFHVIVQPAKDSDFEKKIQIIEETVLLLYTP